MQPMLKGWCKSSVLLELYNEAGACTPASLTSRYKTVNTLALATKSIKSPVLYQSLCFLQDSLTM